MRQARHALVITVSMVAEEGGGHDTGDAGSDRSGRSSCRRLVHVGVLYSV